MSEPPSSARDGGQIATAQQPSLSPLLPPFYLTPTSRPRLATYTMTVPAPVPLIIDTDPGIDDLVAVLLALDKSDLVSLEAITLTFGNTTLDYCRDNIVRMFSVLQQQNSV